MQHYNKKLNTIFLVIRIDLYVKNKVKKLYFNIKF